VPLFNVFDGNIVLVSNDELAVYSTNITVERNQDWTKFCKECVRKHPFCAACGKTTLLAGHHKKPFHLYPELEMIEENIIVLCQGDVCNCHFMFGHAGNWCAYNPFVVEDASLMLYRMRTRLDSRAE
jgi:5-methylcytosine-specific restriction enzyme A